MCRAVDGFGSHSDGANAQCSIKNLPLISKGCRPHIITKSRTTEVIFELTSMAIDLANPAQDLCILCILKRIHLQPLLVSGMLALFHLTKFAKIAGKMCLAFLAQESEHSALCLAMQSKTKPGSEAGSQACTLSSL